MQESYERKYYDIEDKLWLFVSRRGMIIRLLKRENRGSKILEIGCSSGPLLGLLKDSGYRDIYGIDTSKRAIVLCRKRGLKNVFVMDGAKTRFNKGSFDVIVASDVLEHIRDEARAIREWGRILKKGGRIIVFVPAFGFLWSEHDAVNQHFRRYTRKDLEKVLKKAGFVVERGSYWNFLLFIPTWIFRLSKRGIGMSGEKKGKGREEDQLYGSGRVINWILCNMIRLENRILDWVDFPFGVSLFAIARKK